MTDPRRCVAVADYVAKKDDELTFKSGEIIYVPKRTNEERWQGVLHGKVGWFPRVYVDDKTVEVKAGKTTRVRATRPYEATTDEELSFPEDAVMFVVARENEKYWRGVYDGKPGLIVASHVEAASEKPEEENKFEGAKCRAVRSHVPANDDELAFRVGDAVFVPKPDKALEMWKGVCNSEIGLFPASKVVDVAEHNEEELQKIIEESSKLTDEEAAKQALAKREEAKRLALEKQTAPGSVYKDGDVVDSQQHKEQGPDAKEDEDAKTKDAGAGAAKDKAATVTTANEEGATAGLNGTAANESGGKEEQKEEQGPVGTDKDGYAGLSAKERKALEKKKAKEEKKRLKEEQKIKKQEEKLAKKRAKEEAKRRKEQEKKAKGK